MFKLKLKPKLFQLNWAPDPEAHKRELGDPDRAELCRPGNRTLRACVVGVPNAGKSTLINAVAGMVPRWL